MRAYQHRHQACLLAVSLLLFCRLSDGQQLEATFATAACSNSTAVVLMKPVNPLTFTPGRNYKLGPGTYTMSATVSLAAGETLCITSSPSASKPTVVLPPKTAAGGSTSKLHFVLQGGSLLLTNLTLSGHMQGPHLGGGGVIIKGDSSNSKLLRPGSALITDRVAFR
jgi:hypothetical protein